MDTAASKDQRRLGRGLSSLIVPTIERSIEPTRSPDPLQQQAGPMIREASLAAIEPNSSQPRRAFDADKLRTLADSIKRNGTLQPVILRRKGDRFELVAGERRWRAAQLAGLSSIPAIIRDADDATLLELALVENIQRQDLNAIERARAYLQLASRHGLSHDEIGQRMGEDRSTVANYIRLLDLQDEILELVASGRLSMGHARALLAIGRSDERLRIARHAASEEWSVRRIEQHAGNSRQNKSSKAAPPPRPVISDLESRFSRALGLRVRIVESRRRNSGRVIIDYHSLDDFERLSGRLGGAGDS